MKLTADVLTAQELQIAMAVAERLTNREIAQRLFVSRKTVEYHLGHIYMKLGAGSRDELRLLLDGDAEAPAASATGGN